MQSVLAQVEWTPRPWGQPAFDGDLILDVAPPGATPTVRTQPLRDGQFWKAVRQLDFAFQDGNTRRIADFYREYGRLLPVTPGAAERAWNTALAKLDTPDGPLIDAEAAVEVVSEVRSWLTWFRMLTLVVEWVKRGRLEPLWEMVGKPRPLQDPILLAAASPAGPFLELPPILRRRRSGAWSPATDAELVRLTWTAATQAVAQFLRLTPLVPAYDSKPPRVFWRFRADGALQAAVLQWFFQEMAPVNVTTCEADGCNNPVLPPRERFCSETCRQRMKKRRQRARARTGAEGTA